MSEQHTPGRLIIRNGYGLYTADGKTPVADTCLPSSVPDNDEANARRLAACWNWCEGQETKGLELSIKIGRTAKDFIKEAYAKELTLISQRDELLEALKDALKEGIGWFDESCGGDADDLPWVIKARAAIAKVEGGGA